MRAELEDRVASEDDYQHKDGNRKERKQPQHLIDIRGSIRCDGWYRAPVNELGAKQPGDYQAHNGGYEPDDCGA
jgi:hypothetical protein